MRALLQEFTHRARVVLIFSVALSAAIAVVVPPVLRATG